MSISKQNKNGKLSIKDFTRKELSSQLIALGESGFRADQLFRWIYKRNAVSFDEMTDISKELRRQLVSNFTLPTFSTQKILKSEDGTAKLTFSLYDNLSIESVLIPEKERLTLCISTQVGCKVGCKFCRTGAYGFFRNLSCGEIVEQILASSRTLPKGKRITNIVLMGMGEPLMNLDEVLASIQIMYDDHGLNFSPRKVTLSTVGIVPAMEVLGRKIEISLAVSLHCADDSVRSELIPINRKWPVAKILEACRRYPIKPRARITFEVILIKGVNDSPELAKLLAKKLRGIPSKVNLIPINPFPGCFFYPPSMKEVEQFAQTLRDHHLSTIIRKERGSDILAACGQLAGPGNVKRH